MFNDDEFELVNQEEDGDDIVYTFRVSDRVADLLRRTYGDNFEEVLPEELSKYIKELGYEQN